MLSENVKIIVGEQAFKKLCDEHCAALFDRTILARDGTRTISLSERQVGDIFNNRYLPQPFAEAFSIASKHLYREPQRLLEADDVYSNKVIDWNRTKEKYGLVAPLAAASRVTGYNDAEVVVFGLGN